MSANSYASNLPRTVALQIATISIDDAMAAMGTATIKASRVAGLLKAIVALSDLKLGLLVKGTIFVADDEMRNPFGFVHEQRRWFRAGRQIEDQIGRVRFAGSQRRRQRCVEL